MPKLTKKVAQTAEKASEEWGDGFQPLDPGMYLARLVSVTVKEGTAAPYWEWKFEEAESKNHLWENTSLSEKAIGRLGKMFAAFGVSADTDTDDLIGEVVCLRVGVRTIPSGAKQGQLSNTIEAALPATEHPDFEGTAARTASSDADYGGDDDDSAAGPPTPTLAELAAKVEDDDDADAADTLQALGQALGLDPDEYSWEDFATAIGEGIEAEKIDLGAYATWEDLLATNDGPKAAGDEEPF